MNKKVLGVLGISSLIYATWVTFLSNVIFKDYGNLHHEDDIEV